MKTILVVFIFPSLLFAQERCHVSDLKGWTNETAIQYGVKVIRQNFPTDPNRKIIARNILGSDLENKLAEIFNKI